MWVLIPVLVLANAYLLSQGKPFLLAIPAAMFLVWAVLQHLKETMIFLAFITPFSLNIENLADLGGIGFYLPTEPMLFGLLILFALWSLLKLGHYDRAYWRHPISVVILLGTAWVAVTALTSSIPVVSFKFLLARCWFVFPLFFLVLYLFEGGRFREKYIQAYMAALCVVIVLVFFKHSTYGFDEDIGHFVMQPFYKDHTSYGAVIAMFIPLGIYLATRRGLSARQRWVYLIALGILFVGLVFSYTRAAWLSLVGAFGVWLIMRIRIPFALVFAVMITLVTGFLYFQDDIFRELERNRQDSSSSLAEHVQSITNISSDASNLERINRWNSALRMWEERPFLGWGPGTYMFQYAPFQKSSELTIISTNQGTGGNAHSEYLGPLAESGVLGMLGFVALVISVLYTAIKLYYRLEDEQERAWLMCMLLGLVTYFLHGVLNNFLDTDKVSVPFWAFVAGIVSLDIAQRKRTLNKAKSS
jgi:O-antigen ligase